MMEHISVLLKECIEALNIKEDGIYADCTLGLAGHSSEILKRLSTGHLYGFDQDKNALSYAEKRLEPFTGKFTLINDNFVNLKKDLSEYGVSSVDGILFDLGVSSPMFDDAERGFSYRNEGPLDMRMNQDSKLSAYQVVNTYSKEDLTRILRDYGEEKYALRIAEKICEYRNDKTIETTLELSGIIKSALPAKVVSSKGHPAKKSFQAIRIEVNDELNVLSKALYQALDLLKPNGRLAVISFQSLEDRIVKNCFKEVTSIPEEYKRLPLKESELPRSGYRLIGKKIVASKEELSENHRAHSAVLRVIERKGTL